MKFEPTAVEGAFVVEVEPLADERGLFARTFCAELFAERGLATAYPQCNVSANRTAVKSIVDEVFPLSEARAAHERMEAGEQLGKIVLTIPG